MAKCDVCGKTTLIPETFGEVNVCKVCFMKANGIMWKRQYEKYEDAEKWRSKALESANKNNFPEFVVDAINEFFYDQFDSMSACDCCGQPVKHLQLIGKSNICKCCFAKINIAAWKETEYDDNEEVERNRRKVLKIASNNNFTPIVVEGINMLANFVLEYLFTRFVVYRNSCDTAEK